MPRHAMTYDIMKAKMVRVARRTRCRFELEHRGGMGYYLSAGKDGKALISGGSKQEVWDWLEAYQQGHDDAIDNHVAETGHIVVGRLMRDMEQLVRDHITGNKAWEGAVDVDKV